VERSKFGVWFGVCPARKAMLILRALGSRAERSYRNTRQALT
jgi:hypothetical protein